jgi:16S rRNA (cytosine1407-C5)-methyltransferase
MISERFIQYYRENFFQEDEKWFQDFLLALSSPILKSFRINEWKTAKQNVLDSLKNQGYILYDTNIPNVFTFDRVPDFNPFERRLGFSIEHLLGYIYIQELAAAHSVHILSEGNVHNEKFLILDMASSPGWKTTQLAEQYPESFIIANEPTRERIPQILQNLDRMWSSNIAVTLYPWQFFSGSPEVFDRILLDAPCSWEGTVFKTFDAVKNWHIKNIKTIARLQEKLLHAACISLKVWGEMVYSTCTLNLLENEWVLQSIEKYFPGCFEISFQKRYWPHIDGTGGFFVSKIKKLQSVDSKISTLHKSTNTDIVLAWKPDISAIEWFFSQEDIQNYSFYRYKNKLLAIQWWDNADYARNNFYCMRFWEEIANIQDGVYKWTHYAGKKLCSSKIPVYTIQWSEEELDYYLRWWNLRVDTTIRWYVNLYYNNERIGLDFIQEDGTLSNLFPPQWRRK